ncbi:MAG: TatD family hydrolase [Syntrophales bacterium]
MLVDAHCHIDLFDNPISTAQAYESSRTFCVMATMLPSHYQISLPHLRPFRLVYPALGMHPLRVSDGRKEVDLFRNLASAAEFIGEIGLDLSSEGKRTEEQQFDVLKSILRYLGSGKFITVHSRNAHEELFQLLEDSRVGPVCFHYFIGGAKAAAEIAGKGHYFSINYRMLRSKHRKLLDSVPKERILVESDGPFLTKQPLEMINYVYDELSEIWRMKRNQAEELVSLNFENCRTNAIC